MSPQTFCSWSDYDVCRNSCVAANSRQNPGFDFLQECWNDDPALQIVIKKLLAKFPQWGIACVDGVLMEWED
ncbi:hypothetical protein FNW02_36325 [Komarekiella sp. 'clone 1']|uniref:Uncharacterized protein n=1 Tax=Komarekiella delphini-convector SJRDD-AB1 TaxID=2593771 RepID=A0AA40VVH6_9NOST|nr:hypothetical protein [Komarekiella delphini-convector SJRDD-AB1]